MKESWWIKSWPPILIGSLVFAWLLISGVYSFILN